MRRALLAFLGHVLIGLTALCAVVAVLFDSSEGLLLIRVDSNLKDLVLRLQLLQVRGELLVLDRPLLVVRQEDALGQEMDEHLLSVHIGLQVGTKLNVLIVDLLKLYQRDVS